MAEKVVDPVDAVMGEDWAVLKIPATMRGPMLKYVFDLQEKIAKGGGGGASGGSNWTDRMTTAFLARKPQVMTKLIRTGGTSDVRGLRDQMDYLRKDGTVELERSDRYFGTVLDDAAEAEMMTSWQIADAGDGKADRTSHFTVSFPIGTDHKSAYLAGRAWAEDMFASGKYGDHFDYYTAFHTDREHPHMHVVVNRRGLEEGSWLKVSQRGHFDYDEMRFVQVRVAADHGIELEATPRFARGVDERPYTDCEVQRARREERSPQARAHDAISRLKAELAKSLFVRQARDDASYLNEDYPKYGALLRKTAQLIEEGRRLKASGPAHQIGLKRTTDSVYKFYGELATTEIVTIKEIREMNQTIDAKRALILSNFEKLDAGIATMPDVAQKAQAERRISLAKMDAAQFMADADALKGFRRSAPDKAYQGVTSYDEFTGEIAKSANARVVRLALDTGLRADIIAERYGGGEPVARSLDEVWKKAELKELSSFYQAREGLTSDASETKAASALETVHKEIRAVYSAARRDIDAYEGRKTRLLSSLESAGGGSDPGQTVNEQFADTMKETLTGSRLRDLEKGDVRALSGLSADPTVQTQLARRYLETEITEATGARKGQLQQALGKLDRGAGHDHGAENSGNKRGGRKDDGFGL